MGKHLLFLPVIVTLASCAAIAEAQRPNKVYRIGYLPRGFASLSVPDQAFRKSLRDLGYIEGKNILLEYRYSQGDIARIPVLVRELVQRQVDVLVVASLVGIRAAKQATKAIPIVMLTSVDPVATEIVDSLARPGGNITGLTSLSRDLSAKRVELLKEVIPGMSRFAILWDADAPGPAIAFREYKSAAGAFKLHLQSVEIHGPNPDFPAAFQAAAKERASALVTIANPLIAKYRTQIVELTTKSRLPSLHESSRFVEAGGLLSYSTNEVDQFSRAATYVDKILKGAKPGDLPVEQPTKFELVINLKTAKQIGLTIPPNVLARADTVIK
ncbi:MAG: ABC transporter substrate-binding protein [Deltaproteobacteria bacterium]|nr:ABC transporter substrate-binding protein [Deltaproteobacteria bacterium]